MRRMLIKRVGPWSVFKFSLVLYLILFVVTFILLLLSYLIVMASGFAGAQGNEMAGVFELLGIGGGVALVILFFIGLFSCLFYAISNSVGALIYNLISWMTGGIELGLEEKEE